MKPPSAGKRSRFSRPGVSNPLFLSPRLRDQDGNFISFQESVAGRADDPVPQEKQVPRRSLGKPGISGGQGRQQVLNRCPPFQLQDFRFAHELVKRDKVFQFQGQGHDALSVKGAFPNAKALRRYPPGQASSKFRGSASLWLHPIHEAHSIRSASHPFPGALSSSPSAVPF